MAHIKLKAPDVLPATGVTSTAFQVFKSRVTGYVLQDITNYLFFEQNDGDENLYTEWKPLQTGKRITKIHESDPDLPEISKITDRDEKKMKMDRLLLKRNSQLQKCIQMIADFLHYTEVNDVINRCTSVPWIWHYLQQHYNIESKGVHFLKISNISPEPDELPQTYYRRFRAAFLDNLRRKGDVIKHDNDKILPDDE